MSQEKVLITFSLIEVQKVMAIAMDEDADEALSFIRGVLCKRMEKALRRH